MIRVLHVLSKLEKGGAESRILEMQRNLYDKGVVFDYLLRDGGNHFFTQEALSMGSTIHVIKRPNALGMISYILKIRKLVKNQYSIVHSHLAGFSGFVLFGAKLGGVKTRIAHLRSGPLQSDVKNFSFKRKLMIKFYQLLLNSTATDLVSCSTDAALYLFGEKAVKKGKVTYIRNAVDFNRFIVEKSADSIREEYQIDKAATVFVNVGNLLPVKNQTYLAEVFNEYCKYNENAVLLIAGEGSERKNIEQKINDLNNNKIRLLGRCDRVPELLSIADYFVMTSKYEGVPGAAIEAMASGVPCYLSDKITRDIDFGENITRYFSISDDASEVAELIFNTQSKMVHSKEKFQKILNNNGYEINEACTRMLKIYES